MNSESTLSAWWASSTGCTVRTTSGLVYRVRYPGMLNGAAGPDFRGAVLELECLSVLGDVELHVRASDWRRHGHGANHEYDSVVLHVVFEDDCHGSTTLANGELVPIAVPCCSSDTGSFAGLPCAGGYVARPTDVSEVLAREGMTRVLEKGRNAAAALERIGPRDVLLRLAARSLGYCSNSVQFETVFRRLCLPKVQAAYRACSDVERQAVVLGLAGLLPSQRGLSGGTCLAACSSHESAWDSYGLHTLSMAAREWNLGCTYPNNHPVRRLVGLADLLPRLQSIVDQLGNSVALGLSDFRSLMQFEELVRVRGDDYWRTHFDFGRSTPDSDVIGRGKTREVVVNALIPLAMAMAWGHTLSLARLSTAIRAYPATSPNAVTRHMRAQLGISSGAVPALQSQGMLRLFKTYCSRGLCDQCPLGGRPVAS